MKDKRVAIALAVVVVVALLLVALLRGCGGAEPPAPEEAGTAELPRASGEAGGLGLPVDLYFPNVRGRLVPQRSEIPASDDPAEQVRAVIEGLLAGPPAGQGLVRPLPEGIDLAGVYVTPGGVAYLDLHAGDSQEPPAVGSHEEMQIVYSLVDSVALNVAAVRRVVLLWNGHQRTTFAGHLDTSRPLAPNTDLVVR